MYISGAAGQTNTQNASPQTAQTQVQDNAAFIERFKKPEHLNLLQGALWTLTHDYDDFKHMQEVLKTFQGYLEAIGKYETGDRAALESLGGVKGFKDKLAKWLIDEDQAVRAFAAAMLGISGDNSYAPQVANLLKDGKYKENDLIILRPRQSGDGARNARRARISAADRGTAEKQKRIDRAGAIQALEYFSAKEYSKEIAGLLTNKDLQFDDEPSPIFFLVETGTAKEFKKEIIQTMLGDFRSETKTAAIYALVSIDDKESAKDIAKLLKDEFRKADAAKALALLARKNTPTKSRFCLKTKAVW